MKKERVILLITMILNFIIASLKFIVGLAFGFSTLIADSLHSYSDFITDIISVIASKVGNKRANRKYPFGYGLIENIANLFIGMILLALGIFILIEAILAKAAVITFEVFLTLVIVIFLKGIVIKILNHYGRKLNSSALLISAKESFTDFISSVIVLAVFFLLLLKPMFPIFQYADKVGSIIISVIVFKIAFQILIDNIRYLIGLNIDDKDMNEKIKELLKTFKKIENHKMKLLKLGNYYNLYLTLNVDSHITLRQWFHLEKKLKKEIKALKLSIKYIEIEPKNAK